MTANMHHTNKEVEKMTAINYQVTKEKLTAEPKIS